MATTPLPEVHSPQPNDASPLAADATPITADGLIPSTNPEDDPKHVATLANSVQITANTNPDDIKHQIEAELQKRSREISIIHVVDLIVTHASLMKASDIHIDPTPEFLRTRYRIDGILYDVINLPKVIHPILVARVKILCGLPTDEHKIPQDGRFKIVLYAQTPVDIRVSIIPTYYGENVEMRLLQSPSDGFSLQDITMEKSDAAKIQKAITRPYGMVLVTGPTGSGKTTMLYAILKQLNTPEVSIITIEDPIEYSISGIQQIQVNNAVGLEFSTGLRSFLRQDPNIIMVGEIRDVETAEIAVNAALTGHLLLSTLHTNDAPTTLTRLLEFKIEPFLIASTVNVAVGMRLVRQICQVCKIEQQLTDMERHSLRELIPEEWLAHSTFYVGQGCAACGGRGYAGRLGIYEVLEITDDIRDAVMRRSTSHEIAALAIQNGMTTMLQDGFRKAMAGYTSIEEVLRVVHE